MLKDSNALSIPDIANSLPNDEDITALQEMPDGSTVYQIGKEDKVIDHDSGSFYRNLAGTIVRESALKKLSVFLLESIEKDIEASKDWMDSIKKAKEYLGFNIEDVKNVPFKEATRTYDTTLATALIRFYALSRAEFLPTDGPVGYRFDTEVTDEEEERGQKVRNLLNHYLVTEDKGFYPDYERFLLHLGFNGSICRKVYYDTIIKRPVSRFIMSEDFIIDADCNSIADSNRITHVLHLSKREILLNQLTDQYRKVDLPYLKTSETSDELAQKTSEKKEDVNLNVYEKRSLFPIYECHVYLNLNDFDDSIKEGKDEIPLPYIVIVDPESKEILSIRRNWDKEDSLQKRINYFVLYNYLAGFGIRGLGLAHLIGTNAISLTTILRELVDAGKFQNLPGGLRKKGIKQQQNNLIVGPGQFIEVDTGGEELANVFMPLPYSGPSQGLRELMNDVTGRTKELGSTSELGMLESKEDIATGTAMIQMENNNRISSAVLKSIHYSFNQELQLIYDIFKKTINNDFVEEVNGKQITADDFIDNIEIIPIADPASNSTVHRIMRAQSMLQLATQFPEFHNIHEILKINYKSQGIAEIEIEKILKPDESEIPQEEVLPLDPVTENINILNGKPVTTALWQDHDAHILLHGVFAEENPDLQPAIMAHIQEHKAQKYLVQMQQVLGYELPSIEELSDPLVQNAIALTIAQNIPQSQEEGPQQLDPNTLIMADIKQKEEENAIKERIANLRAETDVFKAQLDFEKEKAKIESEEDIAKLKSETELIKQEVM